jgi:hypothetical protein
MRKQTTDPLHRCYPPVLKIHVAEAAANKYSTLLHIATSSIRPLDTVGPIDDFLAHSTPLTPVSIPFYNFCFPRAKLTGRSPVSLLKSTHKMTYVPCPGEKRYLLNAEESTLEKVFSAPHAQFSKKL